MATVPLPVAVECHSYGDCRVAVAALAPADSASLQSRTLQLTGRLGVATLARPVVSTEFSVFTGTAPEADSESESGCFAPITSS